jgi:hypothetical protein
MVTTGGREEHNPYSTNTASLFFAHQQLRLLHFSFFALKIGENKGTSR